MLKFLIDNSIRRHDSPISICHWRRKCLVEFFYCWCNVKNSYWKELIKCKQFYRTRSCIVKLSQFLTSSGKLCCCKVTFTYFDVLNIGFTLIFVSLPWNKFLRPNKVCSEDLLAKTFMRCFRKFSEGFRDLALWTGSLTSILPLYFIHCQHIILEVCDHRK